VEATGRGRHAELTGGAARASPQYDEGLLFHCLVPARHWWDDIIFT
jgi:hypothetical protein